MNNSELFLAYSFMKWKPPRVLCNESFYLPSEGVLSGQKAGVLEWLSCCMTLLNMRLDVDLWDPDGDLGLG